MFDFRANPRPTDHNGSRVDGSVPGIHSTQDLASPEAGPRREHLRSTRVHSTIIVDGQDRIDGQAEHDFALTLQFTLDAPKELTGVDSAIRWLDGTRRSVLPVLPLAGAVAGFEPGSVARGWNPRRQAPCSALRLKPPTLRACQFLLERRHA